MTKHIDIQYYKSPIGIWEITADKGGILSLKPCKQENLSEGQQSNPHITDTIKWLTAYFKQDFSVPMPAISAKLSVSQRDLLQIPAGTTKQYGQIKTKKHARAYGTACATNPIYIIVPCHRVVSADGVVKYGGGADMKIWLLRHEGAVVDS